MAAPHTFQHQPKKLVTACSVTAFICQKSHSLGKMCHIRLAEAISEPCLRGFTASSRNRQLCRIPPQLSSRGERGRRVGRRERANIITSSALPTYSFSARPSGVEIAYFTAIRRKIAGSRVGAHAEYKDKKCSII